MHRIGKFTGASGRSYRPHEMGDLEDGVCRASHSAALALLVVESLVNSRSGEAASLDMADRELLYFAVSEAAYLAEKARLNFYAL